ncbi:MAG TPA: glycosyltransferase family 4 protein [Allosphingosinicella sp.]|nr:glycosyltransferase family 4 protein [Allosphingosinicella sp.]
MTGKIVAISINASWNIFNFRAGLIRALRAKGYDVVALSPADAYAPRLAELGARHVAVPMDSAGVSPVHDLALLARYRRALKSAKADVFLGYTAKPNVWGSLAAQSLGIPTINNVSGLGTAFIREGLLTRIVTTLYRAAFRRSATVFFQNGEDRDLFVARRIVDPAKAALLPGSGIDLERFAPRPREEASAAPFAFLMVARLLWDKGVREYVEAARIVRARHPEARFRLLGFLDVANRTAVPRAEVEGWVAEGLIDYLGDAEDVRPVLADADCVVLPSYREGLPRVLLEASAMGKPLIATDVPGCRHIAEEGVNGFLCTVRDHVSLADAMTRMLALPLAGRAAMGAAARARVEAEYDEKLVARRYIEAIEKALSPR